MYSILYIEKNGVVAALTSGIIDKPLFAIILYAFSIFVSIPEQLLKVTPVIFVSFYVMSTYIFVKEGFEGASSATLAALAAVFSSCYYATFRMANEVQPHLLAMASMIAGMYFHLKYVKTSEKKYILASFFIALFI